MKVRLVALALLAFSGSLHAATVRGLLQQSVGGRLIPAGGISVTLMNGGGQRTFAVTSDASGMYYFPSVSAGTYTLQIWISPAGPPIPYPIEVTEPLLDVRPLNLPTQVETEVTVSAKEKWSKSAIRVVQGDLILITAQGEIRWALGEGEVASPEGSTTKLHAAKGSLMGPYPVDNIGAGGLIGCIDTGNECLNSPRGRAFRVGKSLEIRARNSGVLRLGINDNSLSGNSGAFVVKVAVNH